MDVEAKAKEGHIYGPHILFFFPKNLHFFPSPVPVNNNSLLLSSVLLFLYAIPYHTRHHHPIPICLTSHIDTIHTIHCYLLLLLLSLLLLLFLLLFVLFCFNLVLRRLVDGYGWIWMNTCMVVWMDAIYVRLYVISMYLCLWY